MGAGGVGGPASGVEPCRVQVQVVWAAPPAASGRCPAGAGGIGGPASGIGVRPGWGAGAAGAGLTSPAARYTAASGVRNNFNHWDVYVPAGMALHPGCWTAAAWRGPVAGRDLEFGR